MTHIHLSGLQTPRVTRRSFQRIALLVTCLSCSACTNFTYPAPGTTPDEEDASHQEQDTFTPPALTSQDWIIDPLSAQELLTRDTDTAISPIIWDARQTERNLATSSEAIFAPTWQQFSRQDAPYRGLLLSDEQALSEQLLNQAVGEHTRVFVLDDPLRGWGEGGRLVWMLRSIGHERAHLILLPGDTPLPEELVHAVETKDTMRPRPLSPLTIQWSDPLSASTEEVQHLLTAEEREEVVLIDTREEREYLGQTPYGEERGGHIPGAVHIYFKDLLTREGHLRPERELLDMLRQRGISPERRIVAYCTGGIRSAWLVVVLHALGFEHVENYAGSMWEWSAGEEESHPLEK